MTTFVSQSLLRTATPRSVDTGLLGRTFASAREWGQRYAAAFRVHASTPRRSGMDSTTLLMLGRD